MKLVQMELAMAGRLFWERGRGRSDAVGVAVTGWHELLTNRASIGRVLEPGEKQNDEEVEAKWKGRLRLDEITSAEYRKACASQWCSLGSKVRYSIKGFQLWHWRAKHKRYCVGAVAKSSSADSGFAT